MPSTPYGPSGRPDAGHRRAEAADALEAVGAHCMRYEKTSPGVHVIERENRDEIKLALTLNEACRISNVCEGTRHEALPRVGAVSILPPGTRYVQSIAGVASALLFELSWSRVADWMSSETDLDPRRVHIRASLCAADDVLARNLIGLAGGPPLRREEAWTAALARIAQAHSAGSPSPVDGRARGGLSPLQLRRVAQVIEDRIGDDPTLAELAAQAGMSRFHFLRAFKTSTGIPPHQHVINRKVERAMEALLDRKLTVEEVAARLGFSHSSHLSRALKRRFGVTPGEFRLAVDPHTVPRSV